MEEKIFENRVGEEKRVSSFSQGGICTREERKRLAPFSGILPILRMDNYPTRIRHLGSNRSLGGYHFKNENIILKGKNLWSCSLLF